jgi:hypothetical protein
LNRARTFLLTALLISGAPAMRASTIEPLFTEVVFTNVADNSIIHLTTDEATGSWQDASPAKFTGQSFISTISIPEPGSGPLIAFAGVIFALGRRFIRRKF